MQLCPALESLLMGFNVYSDNKKTSAVCKHVFISSLSLHNACIIQ